MAWSRMQVARGLALASLVTAATATWASWRILDGYADRTWQLQKPPETVAVVVASRVLYPGVALTTDDLELVRLPTEALPLAAADDGALRPAEVFPSREALVGRIPRERILAHEPIRPERLARGDLGVGLNALIPRGMRAVSLALSGADAISGFLSPGCWVDVLVTSKDELGVRRTSTILQAVLVMAVNGRAAGESAEDARERGAGTPSVTFLVTPGQVEDLALADEIGEVSLTLRSPRDLDVRRPTSVALDDVLGRFRPLQVAQSPIRPTVQVEMIEPEAVARDAGSILLIRGSQTSTVPLEAGVLPWP